MTKSNLSEMLGLKDVRELTSEELAALASQAHYEDEQEEISYVRNNALGNDLLELLFQRGDLKPADGVEIAIMMITKMIIGNAKSPEGAADMISGVIERMVGLCVSNLAQIGKEENLHDARKKRHQ